MVKVCSLSNYPKEKELQYNEYFEQFQYPLHIFQKWAIQGIIEGNHVLVTAPTGSGKSLPAEFCIDYFVTHLKKKVIYCSPIKSLSNQKFYDFSSKYPHIHVGIITGDIKNNPDADVLIMTTEILLNKLYSSSSISKSNSSTNSSVSFEMDIENELGIVIFDEIHMINDPYRGHVWEQCIMLLPKQIQLIGLSATLDNPEKFAYWLENKGNTIPLDPINNSTFNNNNSKIVYLTSKKDRAVPLTHYSFLTTNQTVFKMIKDKTLQQEIKSISDKPFIIQDSKGKFNEEHYSRMNKVLKLLDEKDIRLKRAHVINNCLKYLTENEMTPAICYVFSIKKLEICAKEVTTNLLEFDSKIPYTIRRECEQILRKLPNFEEYLHLADYLHLVSLLEKGVAIHHSKMLPILREIVEILFAKGYIKVLFATESVAIGLNLPVKTTIFTDINKFDGEHVRILLAHEYTQAAGRAGRLGLDTVGHVIHLNNLFRNVNIVNYKLMLNGKPQALVSKFKISYSLLLNLIDTGNMFFTEFSNRSMIKDELDSSLNEIYNQINEVSKELEKIEESKKYLRTPINILEEYIELTKNRNSFVNKKRKEMDKKIENIESNYKFIYNDKNSLINYYEKEKLLKELEKKYSDTENTLMCKVKTIIQILKEEGFLSNEPLNSNNVLHEGLEWYLTFKGIIALGLREIHCLSISELIISNQLFSLSTKQLIIFLSCFTNIMVSEECKDHRPKIKDNLIISLIEQVENNYIKYQKKESEFLLDTGIEYVLHFDLLFYVEEWINCENIQDCKILLNKLEIEKEIFLGEFVKALLKITNIANEFEKIAEIIGNIDFLSKLKEIPNLLLKFVVTNQSLYI